MLVEFMLKIVFLDIVIIVMDLLCILVSLMFLLLLWCMKSKMFIKISVIILIIL